MIRWIAIVTVALSLLLLIVPLEARHARRVDGLFDWPTRHFG